MGHVCGSTIDHERALCEPGVREVEYGAERGGAIMISDSYPRPSLDNRNLTKEYVHPRTYQIRAYI